MAAGGLEVLVLAGVLAIGVAIAAQKKAPVSVTPRLPGSIVPNRPPGATPPAPPPPSTPPGPVPGQNPNPFGNVTLTFEVDQPPYWEEGAEVIYSGRLTRRAVLDEWVPAAYETVEFWDPDANVAFDATWTDDQGYYWLNRPLQSDELGGYSVYAFYAGKWILDEQLEDWAQTGTWVVVSQ